MRKLNQLCYPTRCSFLQICLVALAMIFWLSWCQAQANLTRMGKHPKQRDQITQDGTIPAEIEQADREDTTSNAQQLLEQARQANNETQRQVLKLNAAKLLIEGKLLQQAKLILSEIRRGYLHGQAQMLYRILLAQIAIAEQQPKRALKFVKNLPSELGPELRIEAHKVRASAYHQLGNRLQSILELFAIEPLVTDSEQINQLHVSLWNTLQQYSVQGLRELAQQAQSKRIKGWFELAVLYKQNRLAPRQFKHKIQQWQSVYPNHPALATVFKNLSSEQAAVASRPEKLALFLPLQGRVGVQAKAIRDGFFTAHFAGSNDRKNISIKIYDTSGRNNIATLYDKAVKDGAQMIVGPLKKQNVEQLLQIEDLKVPVLTLNFLNRENSSRRNNVTFFGLSPEDEARQIAERAIFENKTRAIVLVPDNGWGGRVLRAFSERFKELGGEVREVGRYQANKNDHRKTILALLNLDESWARYRSLAIKIQHKVKFEPRRRHDVDFIFVGAFPYQARVLTPQLKFYRATNLPIYATSHVYTGVIDTRRDADMNGIIFCDAPWTLTLFDNPSPIQAAIKENFSHRLRGLSRLFAMGVDAYNLMPYINWLKQQPGQTFQGQTGLLSIDKNNRIRRVLKWAQFKRGKATIIQQQVLPENQHSSNQPHLIDAIDSQKALSSNVQ